MLRYVICATLFASPAISQEFLSDAALASCAETEIQNSCQTTCFTGCSDEKFLRANASYCLGLGFGQEQTAFDADEASCEVIFATEEPEAPAETAGDLSECDSVDIFEREQCILAQITPSCSPTTTELRGRAELLVTEIQSELAQYGDLLETDWTSVDNEELLCAFSRDELRDYFRIASENPEILEGLQRNASNIQSCGVEWEAWLRNSDIKDTPNISTELIDQLTRKAEQDLNPLRSQIENLDSSTKILEDAEESILGIVRLHLLSCPEPIEN